MCVTKIRRFRWFLSFEWISSIFFNKITKVSLLLLNAWESYSHFVWDRPTWSLIRHRTRGLFLLSGHVSVFFWLIFWFLLCLNRFPLASFASQVCVCVCVPRHFCFCLVFICIHFNCWEQFFDVVDKQKWFRVCKLACLSPNLFGQHHWHFLVQVFYLCFLIRKCFISPILNTCLFRVSINLDKLTTVIRIIEQW